MKAFHLMNPTLNIAQFWPDTQALGPGLRSVVWVQGCDHHCVGCISPEWIPQKAAWRISTEDLASIILKKNTIAGLTISGGEPMLQAEGLTILAKKIRKKRDINIICYTGYTLQELQALPNRQMIDYFLDELDVLIDGPYIAEQDDNHGLRGSANQRIHYLSERLRGYDFENGPRQIELHIQQDYAMIVGIPARGVRKTIEQTIERKGYR